MKRGGPPSPSLPNAPNSILYTRFNPLGTAASQRLLPRPLAAPHDRNPVTGPAAAARGRRGDFRLLKQRKIGRWGNGTDEGRKERGGRSPPALLAPPDSEAVILYNA